MNMKPTAILSSNTDAVADSLSAMLKREQSTFSCHDGYINFFTNSDPNMITADDRRALVDWCYGIVDHCMFCRETVASAMEMVDRFLSVPSNSVDAARVSDEALRDRCKLQLLTVAALYTSIKLNERVVLSSDVFAEMCSNLYTVEEIEGMERTLLSGLSWRCRGPTARQIGMSILSLMSPFIDVPEVTWGFLIDEMVYLTEVAVRDYYFSTQRTSTIALSATLLAIGDSSVQEYQLVLESFLRVIVETFDFESPALVAKAKMRLQSISKENAENTDMEEVSVCQSTQTCKASNISSSSRVLDGEAKKKKYERGNVHQVSPNSSLSDL